jgi:formate-dependent nitrite reductase membrane component NrfD
MEPKLNGQIQTEWGWLVAAYLFLGGVGSGAYVTAAVNSMSSGSPLSTTVGLWVSWIALGVGTICLLADLGTPVKAVLAGMKVGSSWIARGFWIISLFMIIAFVQSVLTLVPGGGGAALNGVLTVLGVVLAFGTMAYTGILLGASKGIPFWRSAVVPVIFIISALATGHFTVIIGMVLLGGTFAASELKLMSLEAALLVVFEVLAIVLYLQAAFRVPDARVSARRILKRTSFVVGYIVLGLAVPLVVSAFIYYTIGDAVTGALVGAAAVGALLGLIGGLILRHAVLVTGSLPTWNMAGFEFRRIGRPKDPKPDVGLLPPS